MAKLTAQSIEKMKAGEKRREVPVSGKSGLYLIIQPKPSGKKSWAFRYRFDGKTRKLTLGRWPAMGLAGAQDAAEKAQGKINQRIDPGRVKKAPAPPEEATFGLYADRFFDSPARRDKAGDAELRRALKYDCGDWRELPISGITHGKIRAKLDTVMARSKAGSTTGARKLYAALKGTFQIALEDEAIAENPALKVTCPASNNERDKVLSDDELVRIWVAAQKSGYHYGTIIRLLILTGARRDEIAHARAEWLDLEKDTLTIPRASMKTRAGPHVIYLTALMRDVLAECPAKESGFLFTATGVTPFSGWSQAKRRLDAKCSVTDWRLHDLRRTAKTGWQKLGIPYEVRQMMSAHAVPGVQGVYERHNWAAECLAGFEAWSRYVHSLTSAHDHLLSS